LKIHLCSLSRSHSQLERLRLCFSDRRLGVFANRSATRCCSLHDRSILRGVPRPWPTICCFISHAGLKRRLVRRPDHAPEILPKIQRLQLLGPNGFDPVAPTTPPPYCRPIKFVFSNTIFNGVVNPLIKLE
jgi:hypothetical protein